MSALWSLWDGDGQYLGRLGAQSGPRKSLQHPETTKAGWIHVFMLFTTNWVAAMCLADEIFALGSSGVHNIEAGECVFFCWIDIPCVSDLEILLLLWFTLWKRWVLNGGVGGEKMQHCNHV